MKNILKLFSKVCTLFLSVLLYLSFILIYFSEKKAAYISVNDYGEGFIELVFFSVVMIFLFIGFFVKEEKNERRKTVV